jgi:negative regulator of flagellin synthesis FlgM|tara:strand:+ start:655 stop:963 length:309 start_codon:yes stop_codon:yes gene_type:complete
MTDSISNLSRSAVEMNNTADRLKNSHKAADTATAEQASAAKSVPANDELILSKAASAAMASGEFDAVKVEQIKQALAEGNYPLNERRIAESFVAIESMLGGN